MATFTEEMTTETDIEYVNRIRTPVSHYILEPKNSTIETAKRVIAMVFTYNKSTGKVYYGSSIFRRDYENEVCRKRRNRLTAENRFRLEPVIINIEPNNEMTVNDVVKEIRIAMTKLGVRGQRLHNDITPAKIKQESKTKKVENTATASS